MIVSASARSITVLGLSQCLAQFEQKLCIYAAAVTELTFGHFNNVYALYLHVTAVYR